MASTMIGQILLNQFRVEEFIASGGMGAVYRVWDIKRNVPLAMKVLHADLADDPSVFKSFKREANALKKLAHPNIVPFYGLYETAGFAFLLERFVDGPSLKDILRKQRYKPQPIEEVIIYLKALSAALGYAHACGVVHCDVKPANVMIDKGGNIYLTDFGIARHSDSTSTTLVSVGTAAYMAPEQIRGEPVTPATDVYALGAMLFEMVTGRLPFQGGDNGSTGNGNTQAERIRFAHLHSEAPDPGVLNPNVPSALGKVILRCLEKSPDQRYQSTQELFLSFCSSLKTNPAQVPDYINLPASWFIGPASNQSDPHKSQSAGQQQKPDASQPVIPARAPRKVVLPVIIVAMILLTIIIFFMAQNKGPGPTAPPPTLVIYSQSLPANSTATSGISVMNNPTHEVVTPRPSNTSVQLIPNTSTPVPVKKIPIRMVFSRGLVGDSDIYASDANGDDLIAVVDRYCDEAEPALSEDGLYIVYQSNCAGTYDIWLNEYGRGTTPINLTEDNSHDEREPHWSPDGKKIVYRLLSVGGQHNNDSQIWIMNADGRQRRQLMIMGRSPTFSPDGEKIAYMSNQSGKWQIYVYYLYTGDVVQVTDESYDARWPAWSWDGQYIAFNTTSGTDPTGIWYISVKNGSPIPVIEGEGYGRPTWSINDWIAFNTNNGIDIIKPDGSKHRTLIRDSNLWGPAYSR